MEKFTTHHQTELSAFVTSGGRTSEEIKRAQAILLLAQGLSSELIMSVTGLKRETAVKVRKKYLKNGISAIESKRKEKKPRALLTKSQRAEIMYILQHKTPRDYGWDYDFWTPSILAQLILEIYGVKYKSKTSIYIIFKQSNFSYHKPEKVYKNRNEAVINEWKNQNTALIQSALHDSETVVLVSDEMIITTQTTTQKVWLLEGATPFIECFNTRKRRCITGYLNIKTGEQTAFKSEKLTSDDAVKYLKKILAKYEDKKVLLLWDNAPWHRSEKMRAFLETCSNFKIIPFPPYAPDLNPQEHVWKAGRAQITHNKFIHDIDVTARELLTYLNNSIFKYELCGFKAQ